MYIISILVNISYRNYNENCRQNAFVVLGSAFNLGQTAKKCKVGSVSEKKMHTASKHMFHCF